MTIILNMPALSPTMAHGTIANWLVAEGDTVRSGDLVAEIETDKATLEFEAVDEGVIASILLPSGSEDVAVGTPIAVLREEGDSDDDVAGAIAGLSSGSAPEAVSAPPKQPAPDLPPAAPPKQQVPPPPPPPPAAAPSAQSAPAAAQPEQKRIAASPVARRLAQSHGIDLSAITGTGPRGRIVKADVEAAHLRGTGTTTTATSAPPPRATNIPARGAAPSPKPMPPAESAGLSSTVEAIARHYPEGNYRVEPVSRMRRSIAARLQQSKSEIPHFYLTRDIDIDALLALRRQLNQHGEGKLGKVSINDLVIRGWALALRKVPTANACYADDGILVHNSVDVSVAVALEGGLVTPVIAGADQLSVFEIGAKMRDLATRARDGKLAPHEYVGGGTTVSNLGMYGIKEFAGIINPPQATILSVGDGQQRVVAVDGDMQIRTIMTVTLSADHRAVDGALGAQALAAFAEVIQSPLALLLPPEPAQ